VRTRNRAVHVRLGREMNNRVDRIALEQGLEQARITDVAMHEDTPFAVYARSDVFPVAGVGQRIQHHNAGGRPTLARKVDEITADETSAPRHQNVFHYLISPITSRSSTRQCLACTASAASVAEQSSRL